MEASGKLNPITVVLDDKPNKSLIAESTKSASLWFMKIKDNYNLYAIDFSTNSVPCERNF